MSFGVSVGSGNEDEAANSDDEMFGDDSLALSTDKSALCLDVVVVVVCWWLVTRIDALSLSWPLFVVGSGGGDNASEEDDVGAQSAVGWPTEADAEVEGGGGGGGGLALGNMAFIWAA